MKSKTSPTFRRRFEKIPTEMQNAARQAYGLFTSNPNHPSLHFEKLQGFEDLWSVRVGMHYRAVAVKNDEILLWFWIGNHADFDRDFTS